MATILVIGGRSGIGLETVRACLEAGHAVRAFSRFADRTPIRHDRLETVNGSALSKDDVGAALEGIDAVVLALGVPANLRMITGPITLFSEATRVVVPAMQAAGVKRLVCVTGFGAGSSRAAIHPLQAIPFNLVFAPAYGDKSIQEEIIKQSDLDWTIVRPGVLTNGRRTGRYRVRTQRKDWKNGIISRRDVADYIVRALADDGTIGQEPVLTG